jgi:hypothetical protein
LVQHALPHLRCPLDQPKPPAQPARPSPPRDLQDPVPRPVVGRPDPGHWHRLQLVITTAVPPPQGVEFAVNL